MTKMHRQSVSVDPETYKEIMVLKRSMYDKTFSEVYRVVLKEGIKAIKEEKKSRK